MEKRVVLAIALCIIVLVVWEKFFVPKRVPSPPSTSPPAEQTAPQPVKPVSPKGETAPTPVTPAPTAPAPSQPLPATGAGRDVSVDAPLYRAVFTETGARLKSFVLKKYRETIDNNSPGKELVRTSNVENLPLAFDLENRPVASLTLAPYRADQLSLTVNDGQSQKLTFNYEAPGYLRITRQYTFYPDSYLVDLKIRVEHLGSQSLEGAAALSLVNVPFSAGGGSRYSFEGPALLMNNDLEEIKFKKIKGEKQIPEQFPGPQVNWFAYTNQYFTMAVVPLDQAPNRVRLKALDSSTQKVESTFIGPKTMLQPETLREFQYKLYLGPKEVKTLKAAYPNLAKVVNFGWFDIIAQPLLWCLKFSYHKIIPNYGVAIILLTVLIKLLFWPLTHKSYVSMRAMKKLQPKMQKIREKYKNDKEKMNQEVMQLYRTHKVNPLGGCMPMVLQIPVFFALYRVLYSSIAMRHAPFALWINDLAAPDRLPVGFTIPYLGGFPVLTLLMGVSMFVQQKMSPATGDPRQDRMMMMMPVIFTFLFCKFSKRFGALLAGQQRSFHRAAILHQ